MPEIQNIKAENPSKLFTEEEFIEFTNIEGFSKQNIKTSLQFKVELRKFENDQMEEK